MLPTTSQGRKNVSIKKKVDLLIFLNIFDQLFILLDKFEKNSSTSLKTHCSYQIAFNVNSKIRNLYLY